MLKPNKCANENCESGKVWTHSIRTKSGEVKEFYKTCPVCKGGPAIPGVPNLANIARYLAAHPETVDALDEVIRRTNFGTRQTLIAGLVRAMRGLPDAAVDRMAEEVGA